MCPEAIYDKANKYSFSIKNCWAHMTIHSTLHLLGYKHDEDHDRFLMEKKEIELKKSEEKQLKEQKRIKRDSNLLFN